MKTVIVVFDGSNRHEDLGQAVRLATGRAPLYWSAHETSLPDQTEFVLLPGGFSYGDYLRSGAMAAKTPVMRAVHDFAARGGRLLGICNGFQILCEAGLLPGLLRPNRRGQFICAWQPLLVEKNFESLFGASRVVFPMAHGDGNYYADDRVINTLVDNGQVLCRYDGDNPNGSCHAIAGIVNDKKNIVGLMPHPENIIADYQRPALTKLSKPSGFSGGWQATDEADLIHNPSDGLRFFRHFFNAVF